MAHRGTRNRTTIFEPCGLYVYVPVTMQLKTEEKKKKHKHKLRHAVLKMEVSKPKKKNPMYYILSHTYYGKLSLIPCVAHLASTTQKHLHSLIRVLKSTLAPYHRRCRSQIHRDKEPKKASPPPPPPIASHSHRITLFFGIPYPRTASSF